MERKNTILLTVIAVATLLVAVVGATFAYFTASGTVSSESTVEITTSAIDSVTGGAANCSLSITAADMRLSDGQSDGSAYKENGDCLVKIIATKDTDNSTPTTCTYDVTYTPNTTSPSVAVPRSTANTSNLKELSIRGAASINTPANATIPTGENSYAETDLYTLSSKTTILNDVHFTFTGTATLTWTFTYRLYNYNFSQNELADKTFGGVVAIEDVRCTAAAAQAQS